MNENPDSSSPKDYIIGFISSLIATVIGGAFVGEGRFADFNPTLIQWVALAALFIAVGILAVKWRSLFKFLRMLNRLAKRVYQWAMTNWQLVIGLILLFGIAYGAYTLMNTPWAVLLTFGLALATILLARYRPELQVDLTPQQRSASHAFQVVPLPVGKVANANFEGKYHNPPLGEVHFGGVKFLLESGVSVYDTSKARIIDADSRVRVKVKLSKPVEWVKSVHLLINAGGARRTHPDSQKSFEWLKIGEVKLGFEDGTVQNTELIVGGNVREWAIGNFPGKLVDRVDDPLCQLAWRGKNSDGNLAVIDQLEIPILESNRSKALEFIGLDREIPWHTPAEEGGQLNFFVSAITLELE